MFFILLCLSTILTSFLIMIVIQLLRIEKTISNSTDSTESYVKKLYGKQ
jgi:hypothetical protein